MIVDNKANGKFIGYFLLDGSQKFGFTKKPNMIRRLFYFLFLGWKWVDKVEKPTPEWIQKLNAFVSETKEKVKSFFDRFKKKEVLDNLDQDVQNEGEDKNILNELS
jgi:hypothetical protein